MDLGALLVLVGILLAIIDIFVPTTGTVPRWRSALLNVAVILIGIGVLLGVGDAVITHR